MAGAVLDVTLRHKAIMETRSPLGGKKREVGISVRKQEGLCDVQTKTNTEPRLQFDSSYPSLMAPVGTFAQSFRIIASLYPGCVAVQQISHTALWREDNDLNTRLYKLNMTSFTLKRHT